VKRSEAIQHLEHLLIAAQKARSIILETEEKAGATHLDEDTMQFFDKWLFGRKNVVTQLTRTLDFDRDGVKPLEPLDFFNYMALAARHQSIQVCSFDYGWQRSVLPEPDPAWLRGWEPEDVAA
jgi:hypothetical protein